MREGFVVRGSRSNSQLGVLRDNLVMAGIQHGDVVRARIVSARVSAHGERCLRSEQYLGPGTVFFCNTSLEEIKRIEHGDKQPLPDVLPDIVDLGYVPDSGYFDMDVEIRSNGRITVTRLDAPAPPRMRHSILRRAFEAVGLGG